MTTLTLCIGMFLGGCVQIRTFDFPDYATCDKERQVQLKHVGNGYAVCALKKDRP